MARWVQAYGNHPRVLAWLRECPPPTPWDGTPAEWAYTEMPVGFFSGVFGKLL